MGCDIHLEVEQRDAAGNWHLVPHLDQPCDYDLCENGFLSEKTPNPDARGKECYLCKGKGHYVRRAYSDRNYSVFSMLANVRNGEGFAGCKTGDGFEPLSDERGLPEDLSPELSEILQKIEAMTDEDWDNLEEDSFWDHNLGDHSTTWLLYSELLDPDYWAKTTRSCGWVDPWNFELFRRNGKPSSYSSGVEGGSIEHVSNEFMAHIIDSGDLKWAGPEPPEFSWDGRPYTTSFDRIEDDETEKAKDGVETAEGTITCQYFTQVYWEVSYGDQARHFLSQMAEFVSLMGNPAPEDVRLVMGFDS